MKFLALTKGATALVDDDDFEILSRWSWYLHSGRYAARKPGKVAPTILMHRVIMDAPAGMEVDHINGDKLDNRRANLRLCTHAENGRNRRRNPDRPFKGVVVRAGHRSFYAELRVSGRPYHLGAFPTAEAAARAYDRAAVEFYGAFANLNFPESESGAA